MSDHIIKALGNTLMHSLWQGIILAVITGAIILFTKRASAAFRYNLLIGMLTLFAFGVTATFVGQLQKPGAVQASTAHVSSTPSVPAEAAGPVVQQTGIRTITERAVSYFNTHCNSIVFIWFLIICAKSVQMAVGLHSVYHLKRTKVTKVSEDWDNRLRQLATQLHIEQAIRLMESGIAKVPLVVGHLKPLILIPVGLINSLPAKEVEAILMHELAHIRRRDYLVNLMQSFMEIVFFFNPAVLWISQLIKTERENCCDDLTVAQSRNKGDYIRALISCEEYKAAGAAYAMALPGTRNSLRNRVSRIVRNRNYSLSLFEKTILAVCVVVTGIGVSAFTNRENGKIAPKPVGTVIRHDIRVDMQPAPVANSAALSSQFRHPASSIADINKRPGTANSPLPQPVKPDTNNPVSPLTRAIAQELYRESLLTDTTNPRISLNDRELIVNDVRMAEGVYDKIFMEFGPPGNKDGSLGPRFENKHPGPYDDFLKMQSEQIATELVKDNLVSDKNRFTYKLSRDEFLIDGVRQPDEFRRRIIDKYFKPDDQFNLNYISRDPRSNADHNKYSSDAYGYRNPDAYSRSLREEQKRAQDERDNKLVGDLLQDGLITDPKNVSFTLTTEQVTINGKKQSDEIFRKYKEKYLPATAAGGWSWTYSRHE